MNTLFLLMAQYGARATVPAEVVCEDFFPGTPYRRFIRQTAIGEIPLAVIRMDRSQKTARAIHMRDLAQYIDRGTSLASQSITRRPFVDRGRVRPAQEPVVYFIRSGGSVKIGFTGNLAQRLSSMRTASATELSLLLTVRGGREVEKRMHRKFAHLRISGEWFSWCDEIENWILERSA